MIVFDEGDKLFEQNDSINKINLILSKTDKPQMLFYSATYNKKVI
jgi:superfamily II DNA/RNA helicase